VVFVNSRWTASVAEMVYGEEPEVLNPPLPPNVEVVERSRPFEEREPVVVMLGRFSQEKRYHWVVREVAPRLVKEVPGARLVIFGGAATPTLQAYYRRVWRLAEEAGLRVSDSLDAKADVYLVANAPRRTINEAMDRARAFLHATINEHWGIAVAEAMARGLPVVVHKSGGAWTTWRASVSLAWAIATPRRSRRPWPISSPTGELGASCRRGCSRGSPASRLRSVSNGPLRC